MIKQVLKYKSDGNTIARKNMELNPIEGVERVFWGPCYEEPYYWIVLQVSESVFIAEGAYRKSQIEESEDAKQRAEQLAVNYFSDIQERKWIPSIIIEAAKEARPDLVGQLETKIANCIQERKDKEEAERVRKIEESAQNIAKENERLGRELQSFKSGEMISVEDFSSLLTIKKIEAHPRTLGTLYKRISSIGHTTARFYKGKRAPQLDGIFDLAAKLYTA